MKYISLVAHMQETGGEKYSSHVDAIGCKMEEFVEDSITAHDPDEVRRRFFIYFIYVC